MRYLLALALCAVTVALAHVPSHAQEIKTCAPIKSLINRTGAGTDIAIGATAANTLDVDSSACQRLLRNNGTAPMRCIPKPQGTPTATIGLLLNAGDQILMGTEGREAWWCIRTTGTSTTATTIEGLP
jgi:hypothetical protein